MVTGNYTRQKGLWISILLTMTNECPGGSEDLTVFISYKWDLIGPQSSQPGIDLQQSTNGGLKTRCPYKIARWTWDEPENAPTTFPSSQLIIRTSFREQLHYPHVLPLFLECSSSFFTFPNSIILEKNSSHAAYWRSQLKVHPHPHLPLCVSLLSSYSPSKQKLLTVAQKYSCFFYVPGLFV